MPEPVIVFYKTDQCPYCVNLEKIWNTVMTEMLKVYPKLRFFILPARNYQGGFDENTVPKDLIRFARWWPQIILIPGPVWEAAMVNLGPNNPAKIRSGVQVLNGKWLNDHPVPDEKYDTRRPEEFSRWLKDALNDPEFKQAQEVSPLPTSDVCAMRIVPRSRPRVR